MTNSIESSILDLYLEQYPAYNDSRYSISVVPVFRHTAVPTLIKCIKKHKFSGKSGKYSNVGDIKLWKLSVFDTTLPEPARSRPVDFKDILFSDVEALLPVEEVLALFESINESSQKDQLRRSVTETAAERAFATALSSDSKVKNKTIHVALAVPAKEGTYSMADKEFFSWWARDSRNNIYLRTPEGLVRAPIREGEDPVIRNDSAFWTIFLKYYRSKLVEMDNQVVQYAWSLKDSIEDAELDETRLRSKVDPKEKRSIITMIHQYLPKSWMNRLCLTLNIDEIKQYGDDGKETGSQKFFKGFNLGVYPSGYVNSNPQPLTEETWTKMLAGVVPTIEIAELAEAKQFSNNPKDLAIHRFQLGAFLPTSDDVPDLPPTWNMFFESRLGGNFSSQMYRIAKWVVGVLDERNFGRRVLVVAGHGADGKSIFQNVLRIGFNNLVNSKIFANTLPVGAVEPNNTQNGLLPCMDSRVLFTADVSKVTDYLKSEVIKNITGCDEVTAQVKYSQPVTKSMAGVKIMVTTNAVTYLSDTYIDSRVSPIYFERTNKAEADWDAFEVKSKMIAEFPEFVRWCFAWAYAQDTALNAPIHGDPKVWSETATSPDERAQWEALGSERGGEPMFKYRKMDANAEILEEDIRCYVDDLLYKSETESVKVGVVRSLIGSALGIKFRDAGADSRWNLVSRIIQEHFEIDAPVKSHGIRVFKGIGIKDSPDSSSNMANKQRVVRRPSSNISTEFPAGYKLGGN